MILIPGGEPIPGYRLENFLGRGQFGEVWKATSPGGTSLALKFLDLKEKRGWKEFRAIQRVKCIRHPHLAPITGIWLLDHEGKPIDAEIVDAYVNDPQSGKNNCDQDDSETDKPSQLVLATLLCEKTLDQRLKECQEAGEPGIPTDELLRYFEEAAKGIDYLNSPCHGVGNNNVGIQHCDIKPENLMLAGGSIVVGDFGVAQALAEGLTSATGTSMSGSFAYMSPESIQTKPSFATDQYSLAVTYFELRTGSLPFQSVSAYDVIQAHHTGSLDLTGLAEGERKVIQRATSLRPENRFPNSSEMVAALRQAVETGARKKNRGQFGKRIRNLTSRIFQKTNKKSRRGKKRKSGDPKNNGRKAIEGTLKADSQLISEALSNGYLLLRAAIAEPIKSDQCRVKLDEAIDRFHFARQIIAEEENESLADCLTGLGFTLLERAVHTDEPAKKKELLTNALQYGSDATEIKDRAKPEKAWNIVGQAQEQLSILLDAPERLTNALDAFRQADLEAVKRNRQCGRTLINLGRCILRQDYDFDLLEEAVVSLNLAAKIAKTLTERAESLYWLGVAVFKRTEFEQQIEERREIIRTAQSVFEKGAELAWKHKLHRIWPALQIQQAKCLKVEDPVRSKAEAALIYSLSTRDHFAQKPVSSELIREAKKLVADLERASRETPKNKSREAAKTKSKKPAITPGM